MNATNNGTITIDFVQDSTGLYDFFVNELTVMADAEKQLARALPLVAAAAQSDDLKTLVQMHQKETEGHARTLQQIAQALDGKLPNKKCKAVRAMIKDAVKVMVKKIRSPLSDAALIAAAQKIEHYEIAAYGTLAAWAERLGLDHEQAQLISILNQEKAADKLLTGLAVSGEPLGKQIEAFSLNKAGAHVKPSEMP